MAIRIVARRIDADGTVIGLPEPLGPMFETTTEARAAAEQITKDATQSGYDRENDYWWTRGDDGLVKFTIEDWPISKGSDNPPLAAPNDAAGYQRGAFQGGRAFQGNGAFQTGDSNPSPEGAKLSITTDPPTVRIDRRWERFRARSDRHSGFPKP
jgi:hypothetical protein